MSKLKPQPERSCVGIIILNYNGFDDTISCLTSLLDSTHVNTRIYVVDNGSLVDEAVRISSLFPSIRTFRSSKNLGFAGGVNLGAGFALAEDCDYVLLLNNDTRVPGRMVSTLVHAMRARPELGMCGPTVLDFGGSKIQNRGYTYDRWLGSSRRIDSDLSPLVEDDRTAHPSHLMGCSIMISAKAFIDCNGLDETFFLYWEDHDFCMRVQQCGYEIALIKQATVEHRVTVGREYSPRYVYHMVFGHVVFARRYAYWYETPTQAVGILLRALSYAVLGIQRNRNPSIRVLAGAIVDGMRGKGQRHANI